MAIQFLTNSELKGSTFRSRLINFSGRDISGDVFSLIVKNNLGTVLKTIVPTVQGNAVLFQLTELETLASSTYILEYWGEFAGLGKEMIVYETFTITKVPNDAQKNKNINLSATVEIEDVVINLAISNPVVQVIGEGGEGSGANGKSAYEIAVLNGFTGTEAEWLISLKGADGDSFTYEDFTPEQIESLKGADFKYEDFTAEQLASLKGADGKDFKYSDFTQEQLNALKGANGTSWTENYTLEEDGTRILRKVTGYVGGTGTVPTELSANIGKYYAKIGGFTTVKADATDFKGSGGGSGDGVKIIRKNLFNKTLIFGVPKSGLTSMHYVEIAVEPQTTYTISGQVDTGFNNIIFLSDTADLSSTNFVPGTPKTFTTPELCTKIRVIVHYSVASALTYFNGDNTLQLEKGDKFTNFTAYNTYNQQNDIPRELILLKSEIDSQNIQVKTRSANLLNINDIVNGLANGIYLTDPAYKSTNFIPVEANTVYTISGRVWSGGNMFVNEYNGAKAVGAVLLNGGIIGGSNQFTTGSTAAFIKVTLVNNVGTESLANIDIARTRVMLTKGTEVVDYQPYYAIPQMITSQYVDRRITENNSLNPFKGKKVLWMGTSIPSYTASGKTYPDLISAALGFTLLNKALPTSIISWNPTKRANFPNPSYVFYGLSGDIAEMEAEFTVQGITDATLKADYLSRSWQNRLEPFIAETDIFVFDHGWNDMGYTPSPLVYDNIDTLDKTNVIGAFNYLIRKILQAKPTARILIIGQWRSPILNIELKKIAERHGIPFLELQNQLGWSATIVDGVEYYKKYVPDSVHPSSGGLRSLEIIADIITKWFKNLSTLR